MAAAMIIPATKYKPTDSVRLTTWESTLDQEKVLSVTASSHSFEAGLATRVRWLSRARGSQRLAMVPTARLKMTTLRSWARAISRPRPPSMRTNSWGFIRDEATTKVRRGAGGTPCRSNWTRTGTVP